MNLDDQLSAFLGEAPKESRATIFSAEVMKRIERRMLFERLAFVTLVAAVLAVVLWACSPVLNLAASAFASTFTPAAAMLVFAAAILLAGGPAVWRGLGLRFG